MTRILPLVLFLSSTVSAVALAQVASEPAAGMDTMIQKVKIVTRSSTLTAVPENDPVAIDLGLVDVPGVSKSLTEGVTAKAYTRYVMVDGQLIGQVVLIGVEKNGRAEPLNAADFTTQMDLAKPQLDPSTPITIDGNQDALVAALKRLAEEPVAEGKEEKDAPEDEIGTADGKSSNAGANPDAAGYTTPEALEYSEGSPTVVRVTTEGCAIRVDQAQGFAIQQSRVETTENGTVSTSSCEDGNERFQLMRSYSACADIVDLQGRTATAAFRLFYTDGGGTRQEVTDCTPDPEKIFPIVEKRESCPIYLDYAALQAVPRATLVYINSNNTEVQVRGCEASDEVAAIQMTPTTEGCSIRHDFAANQSLQQGRHTYMLDGLAWQAGACSDNGTVYPHVKVYENHAGQQICAPIINNTASTATFQSRVQITVNGVAQFITECTPDTSGTPIVATTEGCDNPATWTHDIAAGVSYGRHRHYYMRNGQREYVNTCQDSGQTFAHQIDAVGWQNHDSQLFAYQLSTVWRSRRRPGDSTCGSVKFCPARRRCRTSSMGNGPPRQDPAPTKGARHGGKLRSLTSTPALTDPSMRWRLVRERRRDPWMCASARLWRAKTCIRGAAKMQCTRRSRGRAYM